MKHTRFSRIFSALLALTMLMGCLIVLPLQASAEETTVAGLKAEAILTPDWKGSSINNGIITNFYGIASEQEAAGGVPMLAWRGITKYESLEELTAEFVTGYFYDAENGYLYFQGSIAGNAILMPGQVNNVVTGASVMKIKFFVDPDNFAGIGIRDNQYYVNMGYVTNVADANGNFPLKWDSTKNDGSVTTDTGLTAKAGWNTLSLIQVPGATYAEDGALNTYVALENTKDSTIGGSFTEENLAARSDVYTSTRTPGAFNASTSNIDMTLRIYDSTSGLLQLGGVELYNIVDQDLYEIAFTDFAEYNQYIPTDGGEYEITLPSPTGVKKWQAADGTIYLPGDTVTVTGATTFTPVDDFVEGYTATNVYTSAWDTVTELGATSIDSYVTWNSGNASKFTFDDENDAMVITGLAVGNEYPLYLKNGFSGATGALFLDIYFDATTFAGFKITGHAKNSGTSLVEIAANGTLNNTTQTLEEGWNTLAIYLLPAYTDGTATGLNVYATIINASNPIPTMYGNGITMEELEVIYNNTFTGDTAANEFHYNKKMSLGVTTKGTYDGTNYKFLKIRNIEMVDLQAADKMLTVEYNGYENLKQYVDSEGDNTIAANGVAGNGLWTDGNGNYYKVGDEINVAGTLNLKPLTLTGANLSLGGSMSMNMLLSYEAVNQLGATSVFVTAETGSYTGTFDNSNYYVFSIAGIAAADMGEDLTFTITIVTDAGEISSLGTLTYSSLAYAQRMYNKYAAEEGTAYDSIKNVLTTMVQYGYMAETNRDGESTILDRFNEATGLNIAFNPEAYDTSLVRGDADLTQLPEGVQMGATLTHGLTPVFTGLDTAGITEVIVTMGGGTFFYEVEGGAAAITDLHAGMIRNKLEITFVGEDAEYSIVYAVSNYLDNVVTNGADESVQALAQATAIYMAAVRNYALGN